MAENQEQVEANEREIPVFTVLKNNCVLKNIFVLDNPPISSSSAAEISGQKSEIEEILLVGRHPDCNIKLEHPSISRFHLRIHSKPSFRSLFVTDLSSVHGTCISGKRIEPGVMMELVRGDTLKLGESSRLYRLDWVPISYAYKVNDLFAPQLDELDTVDEETLVADQDENCLPRENEWGRDLGDEIEALGRQFYEADLGLSVQEMAAEVENPRSPDMFSNENEEPEMFCNEHEAPEMFCNEHEAPEMFSNENEISGGQLLSLDVSFSGDEGAGGVRDQDGDGLLLHKDDLGVTMEDRLLCDEETTPPQPEDETDLGLSVQETAAEVENPCSPEMFSNENEVPEMFSNENEAPEMFCKEHEAPEMFSNENEAPEMFSNENEISDGQLLSLDVSFSGDGGAGGVREQDGDGLLLHKDDPGETIEDRPLCEEATTPPWTEDETENVSSPEIRNDEIVFSSIQQGRILLAETTEASEMNSEKRLGMNIWSRRGKFEGVKIRTSRSKAICTRIHMSAQIKSLLVEDHANKSMVKDQCGASPSKDDGIFTPDKENASPDSCLVRSLGSKFDEALKSETISDEEVFTSDKENTTPNSYLLRSIKNVGSSQEVRRLNLHKPSPLKTASRGILQERKSESFAFNGKAAERGPCLPLPVASHGNLQERKSEISAFKGKEAEREPFLLLPVASHGILQERKPDSSAVKGKAAEREPFLPLPVASRGILQERKSESSAFKGKAAEREPFLLLPVASTGDDKSTPITPVRECTVRESRCVDYSKASGKRWIIVVDTGCLLNKKSRRELQLLRGLRGTSLVIPRIVLRELDCMVRRASFLSRMTEASAALQWIEECMASTAWWIHVQSSAEESRLVPPTPPAAASARWFSEEKCAFSACSIPFSPYTLQEIVTPTAADHILESAILFKQAMDGQLVLLSDDVTLKIKSMAEGVICETAREFRGSLVNPFSARFLYSDSSPRGPTWTCVDDTVLKEKYYPSPTKKATRSGDGAKGLKLILLHNSNFRKMRA
ncbi:FHA domain-containing protein PS1-like isoform X1 [Salvia divinorum]|uniref:FHA domain-containing protein PS1-like isoform X1 n=1 Tax=Salvia divinorum TaxID=28513 RepID=A0ABD1GL85_SALDI